MSTILSTTFKKQEKTKKHSPRKKGLIPWLRSALDNELYPGLMGWVDRQKGEFYMAWIHKKSGRWSEDKLQALIAYAEQKGKLKGKTHTQIKSLLRCAVNSKKGELQKLKEDKENGRIYYKFVNPTAETGISANQRRKHNKVINEDVKRRTKTGSRTNNMVSVNCNKNIASPIKKRLSGLRISSTSKEPTLPAFETCFSFTPSKIPPAQENEVYFVPAESTALPLFANWFSIRSSKIPPPQTNEVYFMPTEPTVTALAPFDNSFSFRHSTIPPLEENEVYFMPTESRTDDTYPLEQNLLISGQESDHIFPESCNEFSADLMNCRPIHHPYKQSRSLTEFSCNGACSEISMFTNQEIENGNNVDIPGIDQYVPADHSTKNHSTSINFQFHSRNEQSCKTAPKEIHPLLGMNFDDLILREDVDAEACRKLMQELDISSSIPRYGLHN